MRLKPGRPDLSRYADRFDVPPATTASPLSVTFLGVSTVLLDDGTSAVLTDGFFSRPSLLAVGLARLAPDQARISACLAQAGIARLDAVLPVHTHFDHALDSAEVARRTDAQLIGGESVVNLGRGHRGLAAGQIVRTSSGDTLTAGAFEITHRAAEHCPPDRYPGVISAPLTPPARASSYRCGEAWSILVTHRPSGHTALIQGSAGFVPGALDGHQAQVAYLGVGQLGLQPPGYLEQYWHETVSATGARRVVLIHWDDFFRPLDQPLRALPYAGDDLDVTMAAFTRLADQNGVELHLPTLWQPEDPWR